MRTTAILAMATLLILSPMANAQNSKQQPKRPSREEITQLQSARMAEQLGLSDEQSAKFTVLYTAFKNEIREANKDKVKPNPDLSDAEIDAAILANFEVSRKILAIREAYFPKFREILTARQTQKMYMLENERGMNHSGQQPGMRPGGPRPGMPDEMHGRRDGNDGRRESFPNRFMNPE